MDDFALKSLLEAISKHSISQNASDVLYEIALDPHGMEKNTAAGLVASLLDISLERSNQALIELFAKELLISNKDEDEIRIFANYELLKIDELTRSHLLERQEIFVNTKEAHSKDSLKSLDDFFDLNTDTIYLGCEITSHYTFRRLADRASRSRYTIFLIPREKHLPPARHIHYTEVMNEWIKFINEGPKYLKKFIRIRMTDRPFPQLYTSGLSKHEARFDLYFLNTKTTRRGSLIQVKQGTSLYQLIFDNYQEAIKSSVPYWKLWPIEALFYWVLKLLLPLALIVAGIMLTKLNNPVSIAFSAILLGIVVNIIWDKWRIKSWIQIKLFKK